MRFEDAFSAMRAGLTIRVPALPTGNNEYFYRIVDNFGLTVVTASRLDAPFWGVCCIGSATLLREDFDIVNES
jgi:hypothetical protein